ncbi:MAG TPA: cystathionine gamma-synthase [Actinomycetes bacterium]|jgi:cystathionine beta-lyase/cystathionine gamma-synthase|nr:cystathionine gamma-synthase [Actinomycetes bacterium]
MSSEELHFETRAVHVGSDPDPETGAVIPPIYQTSTFAQQSPGRHRGYEYARTGNPTRASLETCLAALEGLAPGDAGGALCFGSGMAATSTVLQMLAPGDHLLLSADVYGGTYRVAARVFADWGLELTTVDMTSLDGVKQALRGRTRVVWVETPTNPLLGVVDIAAVAELAHGVGALCVVDNTFATPFLQRPLELGADVVVHSTTKYLGGHSDVVGGALVTRLGELYQRARFLQNAVGAVPGPFDCWLVLRGVKTLPLRMRAHCHNAMRVATFLAGHPEILEVRYPGLPSDPGHELAARQMDGFGGMVSFRPAGGMEAATRVVERTRVFTLAESVGGVESLIELPAAMTHASVTGTEAEVPADLVRLSVGVEHADDLVADLGRALGGSPASG